MILVCGHCKEDPKLSVPGGLTKEDEHVHTNTLCWKIKIMLKHQIVECSDKLSEKAVKGEMDWTSTSLTLGPRGDSGDGTAWMSLWPAIYIHKKMLNHKVNIGHVKLNPSLTSLTRWDHVGHSEPTTTMGYSFNEKFNHCATPLTNKTPLASLS